MFKYEILFLTVPEITKDESEAIKAHFTKVIRAHKGNLLTYDRWGKYKLAYPVNHNSYGVYFLVRFEVDAENKHALLDAMKEIFVFKFNTLIPKHIVERLPANVASEYRRPASLEDAPQDIDSFLKRNDMEGLIKKIPSRRNDKDRSGGMHADQVEVESEELE